VNGTLTHVTAVARQAEMTAKRFDGLLGTGILLGFPR